MKNGFNTALSQEHVLVKSLKYKNKFYQGDRKFIFIFVAIGFSMTFLIPDVSLAGHFGGFIGGIIFAALLFREEKQVSFYTH